MRKKLSILTLGCPKNLVDSEKLAEKLRLRGITVLDGESGAEDSDILLVNTCGFIEDAKKESIDEILGLAEIKRNAGGRAHLVVFGCLAKRYGKELKKEMPEIDALFGVAEEDAIVEYCADVLGTNGSPAHRNKEAEAPAYAYLKIAEGCDRGCSYCVIPSIRGGFRSSKPDEILKDAERHIRAGVRELILVSQDLLSYGRAMVAPPVGLRGYGLTNLISDIASISGDFWIRLLYLNPSSIDDKFIDFAGGQKKLVKYFDIPFQHSEGKILRLMKRPGGRKKFLALIKKIRGAMPDAALRTTLMVGFPGETEEDFKGLREFVEEARFDRLGVFKYSKEEDTPASKLRGHVPERIKARRLDEVMTLQASISLEKNMELVGRRVRALIEEPGVGRIYSQAPEIDGVTIVNGISPKPGKFAKVKITGATDYDLLAEAAK